MEPTLYELHAFRDNRFVGSAYSTHIEVLISLAESQQFKRFEIYVVDPNKPQDRKPTEDDLVKWFDVQHTGQWAKMAERNPELKKKEIKSTLYPHVETNFGGFSLSEDNALPESNLFMKNNPLSADNNIEEMKISEWNIKDEPERFAKQIIDGALRSGFITDEEATSPKFMEVALEVARSHADDEEIGSSDWTFILKEFLDYCGKKTDFVNNRLTVINTPTSMENKELDEKSSSKSQQRFMGMAHAIQKGELSPKEVGGDVAKAAREMNPEDVKDFASTKHKGLPEKVEEENDAKNWMEKNISFHTPDSYTTNFKDNLQKWLASISNPKFKEYVTANLANLKQTFEEESAEHTFFNFQDFAYRLFKGSTGGSQMGFSKETNPLNEEFEPDYSKGEMLDDRLEEVLTMGKQMGFSKETILQSVETLLNKLFAEQPVQEVEETPMWERFTKSNPLQVQQKPEGNSIFNSKPTFGKQLAEEKEHITPSDDDAVAQAKQLKQQTDADCTNVAECTGSKKKKYKMTEAQMKLVKEIQTIREQNEKMNKKNLLY